MPGWHGRDRRSGVRLQIQLANAHLLRVPERRICTPPARRSFAPRNLAPRGRTSWPGCTVFVAFGDLSKYVRYYASARVMRRKRQASLVRLIAPAGNQGTASMTRPRPSAGVGCTAAPRARTAEVDAIASHARTRAREPRSSCTDMSVSHRPPCMQVVALQHAARDRRVRLG